VIVSLSPDALSAYLAAQVSVFFPDRSVAGSELATFVKAGLDRIERNHSLQKRKYTRQGDSVCFDHLNTDQYAVFLYYVANSIHQMNGNRELAKKVYALNKALHAVDIYFEFLLPEVFVMQHPVGTVLGRADYGNYLFVYQQCLVGVGLDGKAPTLGEGVVLFGGSSVIGNSRIGSNAWISAGSLILDGNIPDNSSVFGRSPDLTVKPTNRSVVRDLFQSSVARDSV
jgi:serine O-acetyltransferase